MKYEKMSVEEFEKLFIETEQGIFMPKYEYEEFDTENKEYINIEIVKTAQEVYEEFLKREDMIEPVKTTEEKFKELVNDYNTLKTRLEATETALVEIMCEA